MTAVGETAGPARRGTFFGEPRALAYLTFTEVWERFSYYGMTALLTLYMTQQLFQPGHIEHITGFPEFRAAIESIFGPKSTTALGSQIYGLYTGFVYLTPILGGIIADRFIGRRLAVAIGAVMMAAGHLAMAFEQSFLLALLLLITGCGMLKGNISTQVGQLYAHDDSDGRARGFSIYSMGINVGATVGPIACGILAQVAGFHWAFGLAGVLMLIGLATYLIGYRTLQDDVRAKIEQPASPVVETQASVGWKAIAALIVVMVLTIFHSIAYYQNSNINLLWIKDHVDLTMFGVSNNSDQSGVEAAFSSIDPFISIIIVPFLIGLWKWQSKHGGAPNELMKIATGAALACIANLVLVLGIAVSGERVSVIFPVVYDVLLGVAFIYYWPTLLALVSEAAPSKLKSTLMGVAFLTLFVSNNIIGTIGGFYETMGPTMFWVMHAGIALTGAVLAFVLNRPLSKAMGLKT